MPRWWWWWRRLMLAVKMYKTSNLWYRNCHRFTIMVMGPVLCMCALLVRSFFLSWFGFIHIILPPNLSCIYPPQWKPLFRLLILLLSCNLHGIISYHFGNRKSVDFEYVILYVYMIFEWDWIDGVRWFWRTFWNFNLVIVPSKHHWCQICILYVQEKVHQDLWFMT